jgi:ubiquinol-cytochrome c reductase iron-sulfur subunit
MRKEALGNDMNDETTDAMNRRSFLTMTTAVVGACGIGISAIPFIKAMSPTKDVIAAGVMDVDISVLKEGEFKVLMWRKQPVFILRRNSTMIEGANRIDGASLRDPARPEERVKRPDLLVCLGICTHLGCIPAWQPERVPGLDQPGFYCPCHGGKYDTLGRRLDGPPPENLHLLPYEFINDHKLRIGAATFAGYSEDIRKIQGLPRA